MNVTIKRWLPAVTLVALAGCGLPTNTHGQGGPFATGCAISPRGIANVSFTNSGGRDQTLHSFRLALTSKKNVALKVKAFTLNPVPKLSGGQHVVFREPVTYRAAKCAVYHVR